jgi:long-chain-fatty-acid--[acyl-carrier-protein] ligase
MRFIVYWLLRFVLSIRYSIEYRGLEEVLKSLPKGKGALILPNHVAEVDPLMLMVAFWPSLKPRPIVVEDFYYQSHIQFFLGLVRALPCPNMERGVNRWKRKQLEKLQRQILEGFSEGDSFLIYPAGKLKLSSQEVIGGASFVPSLRSSAPETPIILVRTEGLWGSMFSRALTGAVPHFGRTWFQGVKIVIKNLFFFTPKRKVTMTFSLAPPVFYTLTDRIEINRFLEEWYNQKKDELVLVPYYFWSRKLPQVRLLEEKKAPPSSPAEPLVGEKKREILKKISDLSSVAIGEIKEDQELVRDLGLDSLDVAELIVFLDERFEKTKELSPGDLVTVSDLFSFAAKGIEKESREAMTALPKLPKEVNRPNVAPPCGKTIQEAFLHSCTRMKNHIACVDGLSGALSYKRLKIGALILAREIEKLPGKYIGILLPSSVGAYLCILGVLFAKKIPVMLNWTAGVRALDYAKEATELKTILSSIKFLSRLRDLELGKIESDIVLLEDLRREVKFRDKLKGLVKSLLPNNILLRKFKNSPQDTAVILFTSGTETLPKGVPLSHENLLSNQAAAINSIGFEQKDFLYGVLPPFHSFGFSVTGLLPLLSGLKVAYSPDPTDANAMAREIAAYETTLFCCAPSFIQALFLAASAEQLKSLRLIVSGAEKPPEQLFDYAKKLGIEFLEGYGITECSPVVTLCRPNEPRVGVGRPLEGIELCVIHPETNQLLPKGETGEICIFGSNVFQGYLGRPRDPFINLDGKKWYRSGDLGYVAEDGSLVLAGRLKRFVKIGGEMVSLGGLEEELLAIIKEKGLDRLPELLKDYKGPTVALCAKEQPGEKTYLVLFSVYPLEKEILNIALKHKGYNNLIRLTDVRLVEGIPLTGTGKTQYRSLEQLLT